MWLKRAVVVLWASALTVAVACGPREPVGGRNEPVIDRSAAPAATPRPAESATDLPRVVVLGDSLTAGFGLSSPELAYPAILQQRIDASGLKFRVVNAGVSGDTSAGGFSRVDVALEGDVRVLIVALGGNDGLRGLPVEELRRNLAGIIERAKSRHIKVVIAAMEAPPNFGSTYTTEFRKVYTDLAHEYGAALVPFLLQGVAGVESLNQRDGIHPTPEGARLVADNVWTVLDPLLARSATSK